MVEKRTAYNLLVGKPEGKNALGRPKRRWANNINVSLVEVVWCCVDWIDLDRERFRWRAVVNTVTIEWLQSW
jgi:hypothetical protein